MLKKFCYIVLSITIIFSLYLPVYAASATVDFTVKNNSIKTGETFTILLSVHCKEGINGIANLKYNYDSNVLELVNSNIKDSNFISMGSESTIDLLCNSRDKITSSDIYELTFKVKNTAKLDSTSIISFSDFMLDSDESSNSEVNLEAKNIEITINKEGIVSFKSNIPAKNTSVSSENSGFPVIPVVIAFIVIIGILIVSNSKKKKNVKKHKRH